MSVASSVVDASLAARQYVLNGWALVPFDSGKGPRHQDWNLRQNCVTDVARALNIRGNMGLAHAYSGTAALDIDDMAQSVAWFATHGIDLTELWNAPTAVRISSGRENRGKLLYQRPQNITFLPSRKGKNCGFELRCGTMNGLTVQDVLPPSIHPITQHPYTWEYGDPLIGDWRALPMLPASLLQLWQSGNEASTTVAKKPLGLGPKQARLLLARIDPDLDYHDWIAVGMALHHESGGSDSGLELWDEWSARGAKYRGLDDLATRWRGFDSAKGRIITARWLMNIADVATLDEFANLEQPTKISKGNLKTYSAAVDELEAPHYVWQSVLQLGCLYALTGRWGHAKTALALTIALHVATGRTLAGFKVDRCKVLYCCGENPNDVYLRVTAAATRFGIAREELEGQIFFTQRPFAIDNPKALKKFLEEAMPHGPFGLSVIDTGVAHSEAEEENDNREMHGLAMATRDFMRPLGNPATVALMHPTKDATKDNLQPRGGGAFSGSIDGELCAWLEKDLVEFFHRPKFRGPGFEPMFFELQKRTVGALIDNFGEPAGTVLAVETNRKPPKPLPQGANQRMLLRLIDDLSGLSGELPTINQVIEAALLELGEYEGNGSDQRKKVLRATIRGLMADAFIYELNGKLGLKG